MTARRSPSPRSAWRCARRSPSSPRATGASTSPAGPQRREDHRAVAGHGQGRLPRRQHPRGVRRRWRRHRRPRRGLRGARGRGLPAADDGGQPGDLRHRDHAAAAPRSRRSAGCPGIADGPRRWRSRSPSPTPARTSHQITTTARRDGDEWVLKRPEDLHLRRRRGQTRAGRRAHRGRQDRQAQAGLFVVPTDAKGLENQAIPMEIVTPRRSSSRCSSTTCGCRPTRWSATRTAGWCSCSPG